MLFVEISPAIDLHSVQLGTQRKVCQITLFILQGSAKLPICTKCYLLPGCASGLVLIIFHFNPELQSNIHVKIHCMIAFELTLFPRYPAFVG